MIELNTEAGWTRWFAAYREFILHYAVLAQETGVEALCIGNELSRTTHRGQAWRQLINDIRAVYDAR